MRETTEAIGAVTGSLTAFRSLLLGRYNDNGRLQYTGRETLSVTLVDPELVVEVGVDVARDASGRWHHPARLHRIRAEMHPMQVPKFGESDEPPAEGGARRQLWRC
ncbi:hypothetical protein [Streptomyces sp. NPDC005374]|uniref:hypothetical protein n=1 Tax=Streptomyces sp. NPDC005374 TaxID=3364713 RepID=UPI0036AE4BE9